MGINNRPIDTALKKKNRNTNISSMKDNRGTHSNHYAVDESIKNIFTQDFNISFLTPKKDLCDICEANKNVTDDEEESKKQDYELNLKEKNLSRIEKEKIRTTKIF